ncbi:MAG TPA: hypothetical protein VM841_13240, partial [Actinomycetota bacterium]|nr:hypothetical protein [Actinomycetota bacterium]
FDRSGRVTTYCADMYGERVSGVDMTRLCDQPFPTAPYHVASLSIVPGGDVFAGGLGLFRFSRGGWYREPNANGYLISISMGSNNEGFVASSGRSLGAGGMIRSSSTTIGHWTASPKRSAISRWAQPQNRLLRGMALAEDGSGRAIAVGAYGSGIIFSGAAWDSIDSVTGQVLNAAAWPAGAEPWAFGSSGIILRLRNLRWQVTDSPTTSSLYSAAFRSPAEGVAVGLGGTILVYQGGRWRDDSNDAIASDLYSVITTPSGYLAVGSDGAVVEGRPGSWKRRAEARTLLKRQDSPVAPTLYTATRLGNRIVMGGQDSALIVREADGRIAPFEAPLQGTVMSLSSAGSSLYASVTPGEEKWRGEAAAAQRGTVMRYAGGRWADIGLERRTTLLRDEVDPSRFEDPIYDLRMASESAGWGAGGSPADFKDLVEGHFRSEETSAIYKIAVGGDPRQPASSAPLDPPKPGVTFAAFGESWCGVGLCSSAVGTGTMADEVSLQIRDEINKAAAQPGGPKFVLFTGNMRRVGIPEELEQFRNYLKGFDVPVFVAPGNRDRFAGFEVVLPTGGRTQNGSHDYWKNVFAKQPAPWGHAASPRNIAPVSIGNAEPIRDAARTHYAFDYMEGGKRMMRVVVVDSSTRSYGTFEQQNPPEDQETWLPTVLAEAQDVLRIPTVVLTNQAPFIPSEQQVPNWSNQGHQQHFEATVAATRVSAVITGGPRMNARDTIKGVVPLYVVGGGGAPLGRDLDLQQGSVQLDPPSKEPSDGYYHAWHLFRIDPQDRNPITQQARVQSQAFPVVESLAMHSFAGAQIPAGQTTTITAMARMIAGGFSDPDQAKAQTLEHGTLKFFCGYKGQGNGQCIPDSTVLPRFRFYSEDPTIADFLERDELYPSAPKSMGAGFARDPDGEDGLLCVFKLGKVGINAVAGMHRARIEIEGIPGNGPCVEKEVLGKKIIQPVFPRVPEQVPAAKQQGFSRTPPHNGELVLRRGAAE